MRFYCLDHPQEIRVRDTGTGRVWCEEGRHYLAHHFPSEPYWGHCYECKAVWFHPTEMLPREACPACKRRLMLSHLCHECETFGYGHLADDAAVAHADEDEIACGSCAADLRVTRWHFCLTLGLTYRTARDRCPFCGAGFFPVAADELPEADNGGEYLPMCLSGLDDERATLVAPTGRGKREVLFSLLSGPRGKAIVLPRDADLETIVQKSRAFRRVFDWPHEWAGDLVVERPAVFELEGSRWRLKEFGALAGNVVGGGASAAASASDGQPPQSSQGGVADTTDVGETLAEPTLGTDADADEADTAATDASSLDSSGALTRADVAAVNKVQPGPRPPVRAQKTPGAAPIGGFTNSAQSAPFVSSTKLRPAHIAAVASVLVVAALLFTYRWSSRGGVRPPLIPLPTPSASPAPVTPPEMVGMVYVRGGTFRMGRDDGDEYERPAHTVKVVPFYIDRFEVTCEEYQRFVDKERHPAPPGWRNGRYPPGSAKLPVTGVSWYDAEAYAKSVGKRLPTEEEWEFAARGEDGRLYPWGSEWNPKVVNAEAAGAGRPMEVGLRPLGASPFDVQDMAGNVWEWTADSIHSYGGGNIPEDRLPTGARDNLKVIRGGCYLSDAKSARSTYRRGWPAKGADYAQTGFRCAGDAEPQTANRK